MSAPRHGCPDISRTTREGILMATATTNQRLSFDEFCDLVREDQKADLINGVIYLASPDNTDANRLFVWLTGLMDDFAEEKSLGSVFGCRVAFRLGETSGPEPDIAFVSKEREHLVKRGRVEGAPDLAVEIVSPDSVERDYETKRDLYEEAGVREYWIVDEIEKRVTLLRLDRHGKYRPVRPRGDVLHSQVLPGFWLRRQWLWQTPRPKKSEVLKQILGGA
jgi:Uma2 family endonuclease